MDSSKLTEQPDDPAMVAELEGGYAVTRARYTRTPRRTWTCGYSFVDNADKAALDNFYRAMRGGSVIFDWVNPQDGQTYAVRFVQNSMRYSYVGKGTNQRWDILFSLKQV